MQSHARRAASHQADVVHAYSHQENCIMLEVHSYTHAVLEALQSRGAPIRDSSVTGDSMSAMSAERLPIRLEATYTCVGIGRPSLF